MENESLVQFIKKSLEYYHDQNLKNLNFIKSDNFKLNTTEYGAGTGVGSIIFTLENDTKVEKDFELLGYFDEENKIWIWGWAIGSVNHELTKTCRDILSYGLSLEPGSNSNEHFFIKSLLINSRILIQEDTQLEINLAIFSYLAKSKIGFIFSRKMYLNQEKTKYVTYYYIIK